MDGNRYRRVSALELATTQAALLTAADTLGVNFLITRYGRPVAVLGPVPESLRMDVELPGEEMGVAPAA